MVASSSTLRAGLVLMPWDVLNPTTSYGRPTGTCYAPLSQLGVSLHRWSFSLLAFIGGLRPPLVLCPFMLCPRRGEGGSFPPSPLLAGVCWRRHPPPPRHLCAGEGFAGQLAVGRGALFPFQRDISYRLRCGRICSARFTCAPLVGAFTFLVEGAP